MQYLVRRLAVGQRWMQGSEGARRVSWKIEGEPEEDREWTMTDGPHQKRLSKESNEDDFSGREAAMGKRRQGGRGESELS
jgi:hypothetical protein